MVKCLDCEGSGICENCNGEGETEEYHEGYPKGRMTSCEECSGSGNCQYCEGGGTIED